MIYHIYWGTSGNSGLYLDEIYQTLKKAGHLQRVFVSYYYPFEYGEKLFFRYGDIAHSKFTGRTRKIIQLYEIFITFSKILISAFKDRPQIINYSHIGQSYFFIYYFLIALKKVSGSKLIITCHDVSPHEIIKYEFKYRQLIFSTGDYLLLHNDNSIDDISKNFSIKKEKIIKHPFPIMDLSKLNTPFESSTQSDFLFIGQLRKDKGVEFLLNAWKEFHLTHKDATLRICGKKATNVSFDENELSAFNIFFQLEYISDEDYYKYIKSTRYVILPYLQGTNSGIISTVLSIGANVITSDIPMFRLNPLVEKNDMFESLNKKSLLDILERKYLDHKNYKVFEKINVYKADFNNTVNQVYEYLLLSNKAQKTYSETQRSV